MNSTKLNGQKCDNQPTSHFLCTSKVIDETQEQNFYRCITCKISNVFAACETCIRNCHKGHDVKFVGKGRGICDCDKFFSCISLEQNVIDIPSGPPFEEQIPEQKIPSKPSTLADALKSHICTHEVTKDQYQYQLFYKCFTCNLVGNLGCCQTCVDTCHKGHKLSGPVYSYCFCDCGTTEGSSCKSKLEAPKKESPHQCTFKETGKTYKVQPFYNCFTCKLTNSLGFCENCLKSCHQGHVIQFKGNLNAFCDCPSNANCFC